ncbi:hypothetical protein [Vibrio parahaemolyticus]|uniref:hypothetical protein n=1 Tax=Vibrio parahaemolyticus TaxID=670 RepID=UPI00235E6301|nr:hypothetical protein [Vibrio parahaemolyticus]
MDFNKLVILARAFCLGLILSVFASPTWAVHDLGTFELEGNATDEAVEGDDWENIYDGSDSANVDTGILPDPSPISIFTGGRKDIQDISEWSHKDGSVPDKDDLTNAYAAAYGVDNGGGGSDLVIYFGADRFANVGDAFMGFWFFQDDVQALDDGSFSGQHVVGDVLVLIDYPQGANDEPYAALVTWDPTCSKADSNDPSPGDCAAKNLRLQAETSGANPADCSAVNDGDFGCATTNKGETPIPSPWPYTAKNGTMNAFPYESFYEGGVNLTQLLGGIDGTASCFSSFMAETRSSASFTAALKDFVLGQFQLCGMELVKTCPTGALSPSGDSIIYNYEIKVTNTGFGALYDLYVEDITAGDSFTADVLAAGETATFTGSFVSLINGVENEATASAAIKDGGEPVLTKSDTDSCPPLTPVGALSITKDCTTYVEENASGAYGLRVNYEGKVCNDSKVKLNDVKITEMHDGMTVVKDVGTLNPESCMNYDGTYIPAPGSDVSGGPVVAHDVRTFKDTVVAEGVNAITGVTVDTGMPVEASCPLCPAP